MQVFHERHHHLLRMSMLRIADLLHDKEHFIRIDGGNRVAVGGFDGAVEQSGMKQVCSAGILDQRTEQDGDEAIRYCVCTALTL